MNEVKAKEKTVSIRIKGMKTGAGMQYATAGFHLGQEHRKYLPQTYKEDALGRERPETKRKMVPGVTYEFPESVANEIMTSNAKNDPADYLETVR